MSLLWTRRASQRRSFAAAQDDNGRQDHNGRQDDNGGRITMEERDVVLGWFALSQIALEGGDGLKIEIEHRGE